MRDDDDGFRAFVSMRWPALVATAYLITADRGVAEDCVQEALARMHRRWGRLRDGAPVAYAHRSVVNAALSWRRRRRVAEVPLDIGFDRAAAEAEDDGVDPVLLAALRSLPPRMRAAVVLRYLEDRSEADTAEILGCSVGTVKSAASRGVTKLRAALAQGPPGPDQPATEQRGTDRPGSVPARGGNGS